jgi:hypothetical protein
MLTSSLEGEDEMKEFENMSDADLQKLIRFTEAVLESRKEAAIDYASMPADEKVLAEAEANARAYGIARRERRTTSSIYDEPAIDEDGSVVERVREWANRNGRSVK